MKLRIKGNSLRLRLLRSEVENLAATGCISEDIRFGIRPADVLRYTVRVAENIQTVSAGLGENEIVVLLPEAIATEWTSGDEVSIETDQPIGVNGDILTVLIEKDFVCLDRMDDPDREDAFPHPKLNC